MISTPVNRPKFPRATLLGLVVAVGLSAATFACSDPVPANPRVAIYSRVTPPNVSGGAQMCMLGNQDWVDIGQVGFSSQTGNTTPVDNGATWMGQSVSVSCSVKNVGTTYAVTATAAIGGAMSGSVTFSGTLTGNHTINMEMPLHAVFQRSDGTFDQTDCYGTYDRMEMDVQSGRVWLSLHCQHAMDSRAGRTCDLEAEVRFENCTE
jgi:hypothetical protein